MQKILNIMVCMLLFVSCSHNDLFEQEQSNEQESSWHTTKLSLNCTKQGFDSNRVSTRVGSTTNWQNGDKIYLRFSNGATTTQGNAVYNAPENAWYINYYGTLSRDKEMNVEVYYFENPESVTEEEVKLSPTSAVYHDAEAKYIYPSGGDLTVTTTLSPVTSRVRFKGEPGTKFSVEGLSHYGSFNINSGLYISNDKVDNIVKNDGYSPYIYGSFVDNTAPFLKIKANDHVFSKEYEVPCKILILGESGFINIPTLENNGGWRHKFESNGYPYVDLGLPSGVLWAEYNIGAHAPEESGYYLAWGETLPKDSYTQENYLFKDSPSVLPMSADAAHINWGGGWRMPTRDEFDELIAKCETKSIKLSGTDGVLFTGPNGNSIFFPLVGYMITYSFNNETKLEEYGEFSNYYSSSLNPNNSSSCFSLNINKSYYSVSGVWGRSVGCSVRAVIIEPCDRE